jgi:hypothetical protein
MPGGSDPAQEAMLPTLKNARYEQFAQGLAKGQTQVQAYAEAGYLNPEHAYRMMKRPGVRARVAELMEEAAARAEIGVAMVTETLVRLAGKAEEDGATGGLSAARAAWMAAARLNGLLGERHEAAKDAAGGTVSDLPQIEESR